MSLERIDLNLLLLLDWLFKEKNVSRAAMRLGIAQPTASRGLQKLRDHFGDELLVRTGRSYTLSRLARSLQPELALAIAQLRTILRRRDGFDPAGASETFSIACNDYLAALGFAAWQEQIEPHAPGMTANWRPLNAEVVDLLASGTIDLVLMPQAARPNLPRSATLEDMVVKPLLEDRFVLFAGPEHELIRAETVTAKALAAASHVLVSPQGAGEGLVDREMRKLGLSRRVVQRTWSFSLAAEMALATGAVLVLPDRFARLYPQGATRALPFELGPLESFMAWHASRTSDPPHRWVRDRLRMAFADRASGIA